MKDDDIEIKNDDKNDAEKRKAIAKANMGTLVWAFTDHYGESEGLEMYEISDILKRVDDWEEKLADCEQDTFGIRMQDLNEDLKNFCRENYSVIQQGIDELIAAKKNGK